MTDDAGNGSALQTDIASEQTIVDHLYARLDELRARYRNSQRAAEAQGAWGSHQSRTERDAIAAHYGDQAARLEQIEDRLVFGRLDMSKGDAVYVGRTGLKDDDGTRILIDWRAPAARPFYQATAVDPQGVARRRHLQTRTRRVLGIEDELLDREAATSSGLTLQGEGALMSALGTARTGRMADIVSTIQGEQDAIIRADDNGLIVVQGGPGTGKTAVALHRAAFLLYTHRERLERSGVLVIGPSRVFLRYIEQVLPSLGETGVVAMTIGDLVPGIHASVHDDEETARVKGMEVWAKILHDAVQDLQRMPKEDVRFRIGQRDGVLTHADFMHARAKARRSGKPHNEARDAFALELVDSLARSLAESKDDPEEIAERKEDVYDSVDARRAINLAWMPTSSQTLLERLLSHRDLLKRFSDKRRTPLTDEQIDAVLRPKGSRFTVEDIPLLDELEEMLGTSPALAKRTDADRRAREAAEIERAAEAIESQGLGDGIVSAEMLASAARGQEELAPLAERAMADRQWTYGHVVVDEAQELSPMAWRCLMRRCPSRSFTVVGDLDQRSGHVRPASWTEALGPAARALTGEHVLTMSYRTPGSLLRRAVDVMERLGDPVRYPLEPVREIDDAYALTIEPAALGDEPADDREEDPLWPRLKTIVEQEVAALDLTEGEGQGRVAVIVGSDRAAAWKADDMGWSGLERRISLLTAGGSKGLEFDTVVLVEPAEVLEDGPGDLFVAMTRSTRRLHVLATRDLPAGLDAEELPAPSSSINEM